MYGLRNSELSTCLFQFSHKMRQTMLLYAYFTPKVDFKRKFNHHQSFLCEWRLTARTIRKKSKISNRTNNTNRISNRTYDSKSNRIIKLRRSLDKNITDWTREVWTYNSHLATGPTITAESSKNAMPTLGYRWWVMTETRHKQTCTRVQNA